MNLLFVCTGNICRSAMAHVAFAQMLRESKSNAFAVKSAGIMATTGTLITREAVAVLREKGFTDIEHKSIFLTQELIEWADAVLVMTPEQALELRGRYPDFADRIRLLREFSGTQRPYTIKDPWGARMAAYRDSFSLIKEALDLLINGGHTNMYDTLRKNDADVYNAVRGEVMRQQDKLELIASENYTSVSVMEAQGSVLTNKYAEGYPGKRYYGGCEHVDIVERLAIDRAKQLFGAEHANVQPHSGTQANITAYLSLINPGDTVMGLNLSHGGHLSHGHPLNFSGRYFKIITMNVNKDTELIDYDEMAKLVEKERPKLIMAGASNYSRVWDWARIKKMADDWKAYMVTDIAHYAGLVAAGLYPSPVGLADIVTTTTHKTLRGPRGGLILSKSTYAKTIDRTNFPGNQGGPLMHVIAGKAVCFGEALKPEFKAYQEQVLKNARRLAKEIQDRGFRIVAGGTDCHLFSVDLRAKNVTGKEAEKALDKAGITVNKNTIPFDPQPPMVTSGIRVGTPAITSRGMKEDDMAAVAEFINEALLHKDDDARLAAIAEKVTSYCKRFPIYPGFEK